MFGQLQSVKVCDISEKIDTAFAVQDNLYYIVNGYGKKTLWLYSDLMTSPKQIISSTYIKLLGVENEKIYFVATDSLKTKSVWVTNGDVSSMEQLYIKKFIKGSDTINFDMIGVRENKMYFLVQWVTDSIWVTDGTKSGTKNTGINLYRNRGTLYSASIVGELNNKFLFTIALFPPYYNDLYLSDGTGEGTKLVNSYKSDFNFRGITICNNTIFTTFYTPEMGEELYKIDTGSAKLVLIKEIVPGVNQFRIKNLMVMRDTLFFKIGNLNRQLWKSDGTEAGTQFITTINQIDVINLKEQFFPFQDKFCFVGDDTITYGSELWITDGTAEGTQMVADINTGIDSSFPIEPCEMDGKLFFSAKDFENGRQLWVTEGTPNSTKLVKIITGYGDWGCFPENLQVLNGLLFFTTNGNKWLYRTDGTDSGTFPIFKMEDNMKYFLDKDFVSLNNKIYFSNGQIWESDGTKEGTRKLNGPNQDSTYYYDTKSFKINNTLYFRVKAGSINWVDQIWKLETETYLNENSNVEKIVIYPNPSNDFITIQIQTSEVLKTSEVYKVQIFDMLGIEVISESIHSLTGSHRMNVEKLPAGVYFIKIGTRVEKFVKM